MNKEQIKKELNALGVNFTKIIFHAVSPYQKRRYKPEFVGWEAWIYNGKSKYGYLLRQEDYENKEYFLEAVKSFNY